MTTETYPDSILPETDTIRFSDTETIVLGADESTAGAGTINIDEFLLFKEQKTLPTPICTLSYRHVTIDCPMGIRLPQSEQEMTHMLADSLQSLGTLIFGGALTGIYAATLLCGTNVGAPYLLAGSMLTLVGAPFAHSVYRIFSTQEVRDGLVLLNELHLAGCNTEPLFPYNDHDLDRLALANHVDCYFKLNTYILETIQQDPSLLYANIANGFHAAVDCMPLWSELTYENMSHQLVAYGEIGKTYVDQSLNYGYHTVEWLQEAADPYITSAQEYLGM